MREPSLLIIFLSVFIDLIGFGIVLPLLPVYSEQFGARGLMIGLIIASFSAMQFLFAPMWGRLSDRIGRRPVILIGNAGSAASYALFALASGLSTSSGTWLGSSALWLILASRVLAGICGATLSVASAYIADISSAEARSRRMGLIGMAFGLGFIIGPALGGFSAARFGLQGPGWVASALCASNFLLGCFILAESRKPSSEPAAPRPKLEQWAHTLRQPKLGLLIGIFFLATFCFTCFESTLPLLLKNTFQGGAAYKLIGYLFAYCGVIAVIIQGGLIGWLVRKFGEHRLIFVSLLIVGLSLAMIPYQTHLGGLLVALGLFAAGSGINRPPVFGLISNTASADEQGATMGVAQSAGSLARIIGPMFATSFYPGAPALPYLICAAVAGVAGVVAWQHLCRRNKEPIVAASMQNVS